MKIAIITDQHLDGRKGSLAFWNYFQKFYDDVFFPTLEKEGVRVVFDLGDTFDNRKSMDFNTFNRVNENYFKRLKDYNCLLYTSPSPRDGLLSRMPSSA